MQTGNSVGLCTVWCNFSHNKYVSLCIVLGALSPCKSRHVILSVYVLCGATFHIVNVSVYVLG